jgi:hypothetical protein
MQPPRLEIHVRPCEADELAAPQSPVGGKVEQRVQPLADNCIKERSALSGGPDLASVHNSGFTLRTLPNFTVAAGLTVIAESFSAARRTACIRRIRASVSGLVEIRRPCQHARAASSRRSSSLRLPSSARLIFRIAAYSSLTSSARKSTSRM